MTFILISKFFIKIIDVVPLKVSTYYYGGVDNNRGIFQGDLLCDGSESNLLDCVQYKSGTRDCPADHSEDAAVRCNGRLEC